MCVSVCLCGCVSACVRVGFVRFGLDVLLVSFAGVVVCFLACLLARLFVCSFLFVCLSTCLRVSLCVCRMHS